jgi:hypothetical protein
MRWLPKNPLQPFAWCAVFILFIDCLVFVVLHRFGFITGVRMLSSVAFLWLYVQRSAFAWHVSLASLVLIQACYATGYYFQILTPPRVPSGRYALFYPFIVGIIVAIYLLCTRSQYFRFVQMTSNQSLQPTAGRSDG